MKKIFFFFLFLFFFELFTPKNIFATTYFFDNFDGLYTEGWNIINNTCRYNGNPATWETKNGKYGILINGGSCNTNIIPSVINIPTGISYIFRVDVTFTSKNMDRNFIFKFVDLNNWYGIHTYGNDLIFEKVIEGNQFFPPNWNKTFNFEDYKEYHFKIEVSNTLIRIFINDNLFSEIPEENPKLENSKIGLRASAGGNPSSEVWFDNVVVTSLDPEPEINPVVFVPGLAASINFKEMFLGTPDPTGWQMTPGADLYNNLLDAFAGNPDFYTFYYDWRKPVIENANALHDFIQNTVQPSSGKVNLIGHSLGGLVGRTCTQKTADNCLADNLITVGSPHRGSVDAYPALEGGEVWRTGPIKLFYELLVRYFQKPQETKKDAMRRIAPVLFDLLPNFDYLIKNGHNLPPENLSIKNSLLPLLQDLSSLEGKTKTISGRGFDSSESIILTEPNWLDKLLGDWPDGKPQEEIFTKEGDHSVLVKSAKLENPNIENLTLELNHDGIISEKIALQKIFEILGLELPDKPYALQNEEKNYLVFLVHSPVKISSPDISAGAFVSDELIIIPNPQNKMYTLDLGGLKNDFYTLSVGQIYGEKVLWNNYFGGAKEGVSETYQFNINPSDPQVNSLSDKDGKQTKIMIDSRIDEFQKEIVDLHLLAVWQKNLLDQLKKIKAGKGNPEQAINQVIILRRYLALMETQKLISHQTSPLFRKKSSELLSYFEFLIFIRLKKCNVKEASVLLFAADLLEKEKNIKELNQYSAFVFQEAQEKLQKAKADFEKRNYCQTKIEASEAKDLFLEAKLIK